MGNIMIGSIIDKRRMELNLSVRGFANLISVSPANASNILKRESIDVNLLTRICKALDYDFFSLYCKDEKPRQAVTEKHHEDICLMVRVSMEAIMSGDICSGCEYFKGGKK